MAKQVTLIHRSDHFDGHEVTVQQAYASPVEVLTNCELKGVTGNERLQGALIVNNRTMEERQLEVENILISIGTLFNWQYLAEWGLVLEQNAVRVDEFMRTNLPGVYAAGDIATYAGKFKLIGPGASEAMKAVNHAKRYIYEHFPYL